MSAPVYVLATSSGPGPWQQLNPMVTPPSYSWQIVSNSSTVWNIEATLDAIVAAGSGPATNTVSSTPITAISITSGASTTALFTFSSGPLSAWRINAGALSSVGAKIAVSMIQAGVG